VSLGAAQALVDWPGGATNVKVVLEDGSPRAIARARRAVEAVLAATAPGPLPKATHVSVESYAEAGRFAWAIIQANQSALVMLSAFLFAAAGVGVVNAMLIERAREDARDRDDARPRHAPARAWCASRARGPGLGRRVGARRRGHRGGGRALPRRDGIPMKAAALAWMAGGGRAVPRPRAGEPAARHAVDRSSSPPWPAVYRLFPPAGSSPGGPSSMCRRVVLLLALVPRRRSRRASRRGDHPASGDRAVLGETATTPSA